jgi:glycine/D-amino acid oxidase-like deaminating enzyme
VVGQEPDGRIKIGSTREPNEAEPVLSDAGRNALLSELALCIPALAELPIERHTVGIRSSCKTGPIVAELPSCPGMIAIDGLGGNGVAFAPLIATVAADIVAGRANAFADKLAIP